MGKYCADHVLKMDTTRLKTNLIVNDTIISLNEFTQNYIGNVLRSVVESLGHSSKDVTVHMDSSGLDIYTENGEIPLLKGFARLLVESTVKGMISPLKGVIWYKSLTVMTKEVQEKSLALEPGQGQERI